VIFNHHTSDKQDTCTKPVRGFYAGAASQRELNCKLFLFCKTTHEAREHVALLLQLPMGSCVPCGATRNIDHFITAVASGYAIHKRPAGEARFECREQIHDQQEKLASNAQGRYSDAQNKL